MKTERLRAYIYAVLTAATLDALFTPVAYYYLPSLYAHRYSNSSLVHSFSIEWLLSLIRFALIYLFFFAVPRGKLSLPIAVGFGALWGGGLAESGRMSPDVWVMMVYLILTGAIGGMVFWKSDNNSHPTE